MIECDRGILSRFVNAGGKFRGDVNALNIHSDCRLHSRQKFLSLAAVVLLKLSEISLLV